MVFNHLDHKLISVNLDGFASSTPSDWIHLTKSDTLITCLCCFSHSLSKHPSREWEDAGDTERDWHYGGSGYLSRAHSSTSLQVSWLRLEESVIYLFIYLLSFYLASSFNLTKN